MKLIGFFVFLDWFSCLNFSIFLAEDAKIIFGKINPIVKIGIAVEAINFPARSFSYNFLFSFAFIKSLTASGAMSLNFLILKSIP